MPATCDWLSCGPESLFVIRAGFRREVMPMVTLNLAKLRTIIFFGAMNWLNRLKPDGRCCFRQSRRCKPNPQSPIRVFLGGGYRATPSCRLYRLLRVGSSNRHSQHKVSLPWGLDRRNALPSRSARDDNRNVAFGFPST